jgi:hypothetical protein
MKPDWLRVPPRRSVLRWRFPVVVLVLLVCLGCGYLSAGTWENDSKNWKRAFGSVPPDGITVVNSWYWRSAHWTLEQEYFFEIEATDEVAQELINSEGLLKLDNSKNLSGSLHSHDAPEWFAPKPVGSYDVYMYAEGTSGASGHFIILLDRESGHIFISDYQI